MSLQRAGSDLLDILVFFCQFQFRVLDKVNTVERRASSSISLYWVPDEPGDLGKPHVQHPKAYSSRG